MNYTDQPDSTDIRIENGLIRFDGYQVYKQKAEEAREYLLSLDVCPESELECKRIVATARKISEQLNQEKINVKKTVLEPYTVFENQVKEIISIITEGENVARDKLKAIDDQRKEEKKEQIRRIWDTRARWFKNSEYLSFENFLQERHLNKTAPLTEVEKEMVQFFQDKGEDIQYLIQKPLKDEYIAEYLNCFNALKAIQIVDHRHETIKATAKESYMVIRITGKADIILAKQLLKDVNYKIMEEN